MFSRGVDGVVDWTALVTARAYAHWPADRCHRNVILIINDVLKQIQYVVVVVVSRDFTVL